ncbi:MAG: cytochrome c [Xanthomonadales bacterium]|nr:cytochrome c [Xanthomonadales bacterium]
MKKTLKTLTTLLIVAVLQTIVVSSVAAADIEAGKIKAITCTGCHGISSYFNVYPSYRVPKIAGQNEKYLVLSLEAYKVGDRKHSTMQAQAESLSKEDIADIAAWFASLK